MEGTSSLWRYVKTDGDDQARPQKVTKCTQRQCECYVDLEPKSGKLQCHVEWYRKFTSSRRIDQGEIRTRKHQTLETDAASRPKRDASLSSKSTAVLSDVCLICPKQKWQRVRHCAWGPEPLIQVLCLFCFVIIFTLRVCVCVCVRMCLCLGLYCACVY